MDFTTESAEHTEKSLRALCFFHSQNSVFSGVNIAVFRQVDGSICFRSYAPFDTF